MNLFIRIQRLFLFLILPVSLRVSAQGDAPEYLEQPSTKPSAAQQAQIDRKYGMFMHFGINTFNNKEWSDGTLDPKTYNPPVVDADQWVASAKKAGMKYVIMITKHHDGFCMWDSKYTTYDVGSSGNTTNVVEAVAKACKKYDMGLGLYYSAWDRNQNPKVDDPSLDSAYNAYAIAQIKELFAITKPIIPVVEFWFDGLWAKPAERWPLQQVYNTIKQAAPLCVVGFNNNILYPDSMRKNGNPFTEHVKGYLQKEGYPIRYFPTDFRISDPYLPAENDPKLFSYNGKLYYLPYETTMCLSAVWFYHRWDNFQKSLGHLEKVYKRATANNNVLIINCPPTKKGKLREKDVRRLVALRERLGI